MFPDLVYSDLITSALDYLNYFNPLWAGLFVMYFVGWSFGLSVSLFE